MSSRPNGQSERITGITSDYVPGRIGIFHYAHTGYVDNFQVTTLGSDQNNDISGVCEGSGTVQMSAHSLRQEDALQAS